MRKKLSLLIAIIMAATVMYIPAGVYAEDTPVKEVNDLGKITYEEGPNGTGYINIEGRSIKLKEPVDADTPSEQFKRYGSSAINADKYDSRNTVGVAVKDQEDTGLCWAFSMTTAAESDYYKDNNKYVELSPAHLGYFFYNRINDPLGNTDGDRNINRSTQYSWMDIGGNVFFGSQALASWTGFADESTSPFSNRENGYSSDVAYDNSVILKNAEFLDEFAEVKTAIVENGAALVSYHAPVDSKEDSLYYNSDTYGYYCYDGDEYNANHAVTIVGWNDNYSSKNFVKEPIDKNGDPINGAWIIQNSWGKYSGSDGGCFYLSYADKTICDLASLDVQPADTYDYNYQYDGNALPVGIPMYAGDKAANVYSVTDVSGQLLEAVNFTTWGVDAAKYKVEVYTDITNVKNPLSGVKACSFDVSTDNAGVYTFRFEDYGIDPVYLEPGTSYSIVITTNSDTELGVEASHLDSTFRFTAENEMGQSFVYEPEIGWYDCYESDYSIRIKGLVSVADQAIVPEAISIKEAGSSGTISLKYGNSKQLTVGYTPANTTVRDITWSSSDTSIAKVSASGKVTTAGIGTATITAKASNGITAKLQVKVTVPNLAAPKTISANLYGHDDLKATWSKVSGATGYYVYYKRSTWSNWKSLDTTTNIYKKVAGLTDGAKYKFKVYPYVKINGKKYKDSSYKSSSYVYTLKKLNRPTVKKQSKYYVKVSWNNIYGESGYQIARSTKKSSGYKIVKSASYKYKSAKIKTPRKKKYYYKIRAYKTVSGKKIYGPWSSVRSYNLR